MIFVVTNIDVARSINSNVRRFTYLGSCRDDVITVVATDIRPSNCCDDASAHCYFPNAIVFKVGDIDVARSINSNRVREV
jgi:hypothetical protein